MARIVERPKARQELEDIAVHIGTNRPSAARRFLAAAQKVYGTLAAMPEVGALWERENPRFAGVRHFPIPRYPNYVIFYRPLSGGVEILHIFHAARDLRTILEEGSRGRGRFEGTEWACSLTLVQPPERMQPCYP
jgi:toxin ParE1/3/4